MKPMYGMGAMLKKYMGGGMMEYPGGGLMPKQYDDGGPLTTGLTRAEARALAEQFRETGELTPEMKEIAFANLSESEIQLLEDGLSAGRFGQKGRDFDDNQHGMGFIYRSIKENKPLTVNPKFRQDFLKDPEGDLTADNLRGKYDLYGRDDEIKVEGEGRKTFKRGDKGPYAIGRNRIVKGDGLKFPFLLGDKMDYASTEIPVQEERREDPVDPVTPREPVVVRRDPEPTPQRRPEPEPERTYGGELPEVVITAGGDPEVRRDRTGGIPIGDLLAMPSDYTGSGGADRAGGPFAQEKLSKAQLFEALNAMQNRYGGFPFRKKKSRYRR